MKKVKILIFEESLFSSGGLTCKTVIAINDEITSWTRMPWVHQVYPTKAGDKQEGFKEEVTWMKETKLMEK